MNKALQSILDQIRHLLRPITAPAPPPRPAAMRPAPVGPPLREQRPSDPRAQAQLYLNKVQAKINKLAQDFNAGIINRAQFQNLYGHYQQEMRNVDAMLETAPAGDQWQGAVTEGESVVIRRRHLARAQGYAIYENQSGLPLATLGKFGLDPALVVPMLSAYRSAAQEIFGAAMRATEIEGGRWLSFVPGEFATMLAVFSTEPAARQLAYLEELHRIFEQANRALLANGRARGEQLLFPHEYFLGQWRR